MSQRLVYNQMEDSQNGLSIREDTTLPQLLSFEKNDFSERLNIYHQEIEFKLITNLPSLKIRQEKRAFEKMRSDFLRNPDFRGKFVAILEEEVIDLDEDEKSLFRRVYQTYGYVPVYIQKVEEEETIEEVPSPIL